jgi:hypothetical protein
MLKLFISYSHKDREWCDRLNAHLAGISKEVLAEVWYDKRISPGSEWNSDIVRHLDEADIILFLVSSNFVNSEFCALEVERALARQEAGKCTVIPVMLRHYNLSGSGYTHLQPSPQGGGPIDSDAWPDKDLGLKTVSNEIETKARSLLGNAPKHQSGLVNPLELQRLLHHLCDRLPQRRALHQALEPERRKEQRPFLIVVLGHQQDSLEWFLSRLEHVLLKKYFSQSVGRLSPLEWPEYVRGQTSTQLFGPCLTDCLNARPFATLEEMNGALSAMSPVSLLPSSVPAATWDRNTEALFDAYLALWQSWPKIPADRVLIPVVCIEYSGDLPAQRRLLRYLKKLNFESLENIGGVLLPQMTAVEHAEFKDWLRLDQVRPRIPGPENAIDKSNLLTSVFPSRMYQLAETHLPRFLQKL